MGNQKRTWIVAFSLGAIALAAVWLTQYYTGSRRATSASSDDAVAGWRMGSELRQRLSEGKLVVLLPGTPDSVSPSLQAAFTALKQAVNEASAQFEVVPANIYSLIGATNGDDTMFLYEEGLPSSLFDQAFESYPNSDAIVSLAGLPKEFQRPGFSNQSGPLLAAIDLMMLSGRSWKRWLRTGTVSLLILPRADLDYETDVENLPREEHFQERFVLLTEENWKDRSTAVKGLF